MTQERIETPDFAPVIGQSLEEVIKELSSQMVGDSINEFKEKAKGILVKVSDAKKLVRLYELELAKMYQAYKDGVL